MPYSGIVLSCEHGGNIVPPMYLHLFRDQKSVLQTHRGWDPGALLSAQLLSTKLDVPLVYSRISRLLIEMNRSLDTKDIFSSFSLPLEDGEKIKLIDQYYTPYRQKIKATIDSTLSSEDKCIHYSIHTFTPDWQGQSRPTDIGILFDPTRSFETEISLELKSKLAILLPGMQIDLNEPYKGTDDGLTTSLRNIYDDQLYAGIEIEINQKWVNKAEHSIINNALIVALPHLQKRKPVVI
ncbi:N-formylglutamate amidohydrolase [Porifericola rhodea]|uniref:N-formylglutamate amidohydrolase n=1 Tax=Porifericola rhodea TaxID=930972 RepID=UPI00266534FD|nr:N-formylglutamate amidohydrolase [Porifericola rhodea]WKN30792.1 N-formylglutamate amidohydrolase [Porifericola rhodea]